jgi:hypothetical protein
VEIKYLIDKDDVITDVSGSWNEFAGSNDAPELDSAKVVGNRIWDFVQDSNTRQIYRHIVARARTGNPAQFDFRCDAPRWRRLMKMTVVGKSDDAVEFTTQLIDEIARPAEPILDRSIARTKTTVTMCAWCARFRTGSNEWHEVDSAAVRLQLFHGGKLPQLTHGVCASCQELFTIDH